MSLSIKVEMSQKGGNQIVDVNNLSPSTTIAQVKERLNVRPNSHFGRVDQFENWDNRRTLGDYFVKNGEKFSCVIQCMIEDGQPTCDDYNEWLANNPQ